MPLTQTIMRPWTGLGQQIRQRRRTSALMLLITAFLTAGGAYIYLSPYAWGYYHWWRAAYSLQNHDFAPAIAHLECCLQIWPQSAATHFLLGRTCRRHDDMTAARRHLQTANALHHSLDDLRLEFQLIEAQVGAVPIAEKALEEDLVRGHADELLIYEALAKGFTRLNYFDDAYNCATKWVKLAPNDWYAYYIRGLVLERGQSFRKAVEDYEHALALRPDHLDARLHVADILSHWKSNDEALEHYQKCLYYHPATTVAVVGAARCLVRLGRDAEAHALVEQCVSQPGAETNKSLAEAFLICGDLEWHHDRTEKALAMMRKAAALAPMNPQVNRRLALLLRALGKTTEAQEFEDKAVLVDRTFIRMDEIIARLRGIGRVRVGSAEAREAADLRWEAGASLLKIGRDEEGVAWLISASQIDPTHEQTNQSLKQYYKEKGPLVDFSNAQ